MQQNFNLLLLSMTALAAVVYIALQYVKVGYGWFYNRKWGKPVSNRIGWMIMEMPVFLLMTLLWLVSDRLTDPVRIVMLLFFEIHYFSSLSGRTPYMAMISSGSFFFGLEMESVFTFTVSFLSETFFLVQQPTNANNPISPATISLS